MKVKKNKSPQNRSAYKTACRNASKIIDGVRNKYRYWTEKIDIASGNQKQLYAIITKFLGINGKPRKSPERVSDYDAAEDLKDFFQAKVNDIYENIKSEQLMQANKESSNKTKCETTKSCFKQYKHDALK